MSTLENKRKVEKETKKILDKVYVAGFRNGQIEMKNSVLKKINRDWTLITIRPPMDLVMKILKMVDKIKLKAATPN